MAQNDEAKIVVTFDTAPARAALDDLARHGQQAVDRMGFGDAWRTPRGGGGAPGGGSGGARTPPAAPGGPGGGGAAQAAVASRGIGRLGGIAAAAMSVPGVAPMAGAITGGIYGGASDALGNAPGALRVRVERHFFGTGPAEGRGEKAALARVQDAYAYLAGGPDAAEAIEAARPVYEQLRAYETRRSIGRDNLAEAFSPSAGTVAQRYMGPGMQQVLGAGSPIHGQAYRAVAEKLDGILEALKGLAR